MTTPDPRARRTLARRRRGRAARRVLWRARFAVVAICCGVAASSAAQALRPEPPPTRDVVVAARLLAAGAEIRRADVEVRAVPVALAPTDALTDPADAVGRVPPVPLAAGLPLSAELVAGGAVTALAPEGTVVVPVRLDDATAALLRPGDRVDLVATSSLGVDDAAYLARRALVLPSAARRGEGDGGGDGSGGVGGLLGGASTGGASTGAGPPVALLAVDPAEAPGLSAASGMGAVGAVLVP
ncbi:Flp pilus assembly protein CpaB [Xylanimonas ulmi]|uniref:Flp pilus assembly protein CpaB n=1 Tax=Xylanimonas ulmi TaxID=228973 RepID=A0A4Q7M3R4_9MICO|nr:Flp pilus assembly protein CpaB [Xylanibacterium ulmi]RZS61981.1 Flp pilus assembly protein CpaB [Xylanibacterium ulmi]